MIIDSHMHIGYEHLLSTEIVDFMKRKGMWETMRARLSPQGVIETLDEADIDWGVIFPLTFMPPDGIWQALNDMTAEYVRAYPDRLIGYAIINPRDIPATLVELERAAACLDLRGIKLHPSMQAFYPNAPEIFPVYEFAQAQGWPVLCHTGASTASHADKYSHPLLLDEVAVNFPDLKLIMAHTGRPWYQDAGLVLRKHANVYCDLCANVGRTGGTALLEMMLINTKIYADGLRRMLFATDFPIFDPAAMLRDLHAAAQNNLADRMGLPGVTPDELDGILWRNAAALLNLEEKIA
jgi:predicted TIM-barrel fold metal-dependent hydrolase